MNRLASAMSPYLPQHADNPVHWWQWEEAFAEAKQRDLPLVISVGYSACHWCHVMAYESFEDEQVAQLLNQQFVSIKELDHVRRRLGAPKTGTWSSLTRQ